MASVKEKVYAEMENITTVLSELEKVKDKPHKEMVVLVGIRGISSKRIYRNGKHFETIIITQRYLITNHAYMA